MSLAKQLYDLQEIDSDLEKMIEALKHIESQLGDEAVLVQARRELEMAQQYLAKLEEEQRAVEWEADDLHAKIVPVEKKLYNGSVKNPKELVNLQQEAKYLKAREREREDKALEVMTQVEEEQKKMKLAREGLKRLKKQWEERQNQLLAEQAELQTLIAGSEEKRHTIAARVDPANLEIYEILRKKKQGKAVARVEQGRCHGCRLTLPISDLKQARAGERLVQCSSCGCILYLPT